MHLPSIVPAAVATLLFTAAASAQCGEGAQGICYGEEGGEPQGLDLDDLQYVADYLRYIGESQPGALFTMPGGFTCQEWGIEVPGAGTVLPLAKQTGPRVTPSVLYADIANTIDGGADATPEQRAESLIGCAASGGQVGIKTDPKNPYYNTDSYKASGAKPTGLVIKVVRAPESKKL
ncbi:hypothetical protein CPLU01_13086 [Colletotrichum plurivorum]|uniref:Uncharacterized protein n=1 Tax=Colletotrichum plurivorum TaxID=2175906 RepID=A0A8H6JTR9_9PEZI|nr:hypothetical protein CPLU01_13086 [Colletotrichum plurivorum]